MPVPARRLPNSYLGFSKGDTDDDEDDGNDDDSHDVWGAESDDDDSNDDDACAADKVERDKTTSMTIGASKYSSQNPSTVSLDTFRDTISRFEKEKTVRQEEKTNCCLTVIPIKSCMVDVPCTLYSACVVCQGRGELCCINTLHQRL